VAEISKGAIMRTAHLHTPEIREKSRLGKLNSEVYKDAHRKKAIRVLHSPEAIERRRKAQKTSLICRAQTKKMIEVMMQSEKCKAGLKHHAGRKWHIRSPSNVEYHFVNLLEFIRSHSHLFDPNDIPVKAHRGIQGLRPSDTRKRVNGSWKGWTWISYCEAFYNSSNDLLDRNVENK